MTPATAPAGLARRYAAWSLDAAPVLLAALAVCASRLGPAVDRLGAAFDALCTAAASATIDLMLHGTLPAEIVGQWLADPVRAATIGAFAGALGGLLWPPLLAFAAIAFVWFVGFEASPWQATPGKRLLALRVTDAGGARPGFGRVALRHLAGSLSWLTLNIGHLVAATPPRYTALHDRIAGTRVRLDGAPAPLPAWARAWIALQAVAGVAALGGFFLVADAAMQRAFDALL